MKIDIIPLTDEEYAMLPTAKKRAVRNAQQKKNELYERINKELEIFREKVYAAGMKHSSLYETKKAALFSESEDRCNEIAEALLFELNSDKFLSGGTGVDGDVGYLVDYSLSYNQRYIVVRDYYLAIKDREERMRRYGADEVAKDYLGGYYETLYNVLATIDRA